VSAGHDFGWQVIPAGAAHGAILGVVGFGVGVRLYGRTVRFRLLAAPLVGWIAGFVSWIPLNQSLFDDPWAKTLLWPLHESGSAALLAPFLYFGLVSLLYYLCLVLVRHQGRTLGVHLLLAGAAGFLGSLWWWIAWEHWYLSPLHGAIWGACVGTAAWSAFRSNANPGPVKRVTVPAA